MNLKQIPDYIVGIDPDSSRHGVAVYVDAKIISLSSMSLFELYDHVKELIKFGYVQIHIEDVRAINTTFRKQFVKNRRAETTISRSVGMCQQSQAEVERMAEYLGVEVVKHPISSKWKDASTGNAILKKLGWTGKSNEDTRSAAYFGYCGVRSWHTANQK